jgi:hypothetical protein
MADEAIFKFEPLEGEAHKLANDFDRLGDGFSDLGGAFIKIVDDASSTDVNFLKADLVTHVKHDVFTVGQDFFKIGEEFIKLTGPLDTVGDAIVKFTDQFIKFMPSESETPFSLAADFLQFEGDLKLTGLDFLGAASDIKSSSPLESMSLSFDQISVDYQNQAADALKLSEDFADFIKFSGLSESKADEPFIQIKIETVIISSAASSLSTDFQKISTDLAVASDSGLKTFDQIVHKYADDFKVLAQDLKVADGAFASLGGAFIKLADAIEHSGPITIPTST